MSAKQSQIAGAEFIDNNNQRTPCIIVVDASGSMAGNKIDELNGGLKELESRLKTNVVARDKVQLAVIRVDSTATLVTDWCDAADFLAPKLDASGLTALGAGVEMALNMIEERKALYRANAIPYTRPWMFVITDGEPNDDGWEAKAGRARQEELDRKVVMWPIGVEGANLQQLGKFKGDGRVFQLAKTDFNELFVWLSNSLSEVSATKAGAVRQIEAPPMITVPT